MGKSSTGSYTVPEEIKALKPKDVICDVKLVKGHFYVYLRGERIPNPKKPGKLKNTSGKLIGKIEHGEYIPKYPAVQSVTNFTVIPSVLDYGPYAIAMECSKDTLDRLSRFFVIQEARTIYVIGLIYFVNHFTPARDLREVYLQSVISLKWPAVALSENTVSKFFYGLGRNRLHGIRFEQSLIDDGSKEIAIDGHVILCASDMNELADYGNKYQKIGDTQMNIMMMFDVGLGKPIMCSAFDGSLPDKIEIKDVFRNYNIENATLIMDSGFYSEADIALYHQNGNLFVIPVPGSTQISKALLKENPITYSSSFSYSRRDSTGKITETTIMWMETTVTEAEDLVNEYLKAKAEAKNQELAQKAKPDETPRKVYAQKASRSKFASDRLIIFRDCQMHDKLTAEYRSNIGNDSKHSQEELDVLEKTFGVILLRTNDKKKTPEQIYLTYKKRWKIETNYNYVRNGVDFNALHSGDYYVTQGISFILMVEGLIYSSFISKIKQSSNKLIANMSVSECLVNSARLKLAKKQDGEWAVNEINSRQKALFEEFGVNIEEQVSQFNKGLSNTTPS